MSTISSLIETLNLEKHPEGGYYSVCFQPDIESGSNRATVSSIYYMLTGNDFSAFHKLDADEIWNFYSGNSATIIIINPSGELKKVKLGDPSRHSGAAPQAVVKKNHWFSVEINTDNEKNRDQFSLFGCIVSPAFSYDGFQLANPCILASQYPKHKEIINRLSRTEPVKDSPDTIQYLLD